MKLQAVGHAFLMHFPEYESSRKIVKQKTGTRSCCKGINGICTEAGKKMSLLKNQNRLLWKTSEELTGEYNKQKTVTEKSVGKLEESVARSFLGWRCLPASLF